MLDLSNNNATGHNFSRAYFQGGQRRLYLKCVQGTTFVDPTYKTLRKAALAVHFHVGAYAFLEPAGSSKAAADFLLSHLELPLVPGRDLRPALDLETGTPTPALGAWARGVADRVAEVIGCRPVIYGSGWYLEQLRLATAPGPLWLAAYGRDDGKEYPIGALPAPWREVAAHQFTSRAAVVGIRGLCDLSSVKHAAELELPRGAVH
jgi:GH25 family lysozyme M1 (1,4-beta-N-acetylmuramidase)